MAVILAGLSAVMYGAADFLGGMGTRKSPVFTVLVYSQLVGLVLAVSASALLGQRVPAAGDIAWGVLAGISGVLGLGALYTALATTPVAVASPVSAVTGAVVPVMLGLAAGERPAWSAWIGIALAVPAILFLTMGSAGGEKDAKTRRAFMLGLAAGLGFGFFFFVISRTSRSSGLWPLAAARVSTIGIVALFALFAGRSLRPPPTALPVIILSGALDMGANIAFLLASRTGMLSITAVVTSLFPAPTVLLAWLVFRERVTAPRVVGLALAIAGVAFISL